jgi:hypothetical protein
MKNLSRWCRLASVGLLVLTGCAGAPSPQCVPECTECREIAVQELRVHRSGRHFQTGSRSPRVHACSCCQVEVSLYEENGKPMLRCPKCAPAGVECAACESVGSQGHTHASK